MSRMNLLLDLRGYDGENTNTANTTFNRNLQYIGVNLDDELIQEATIKANSRRLLLSSSLVSGFQNSTEYPATPIPAQETLTLTTNDDLDHIYIPKKIVPNTLMLSIGRLMAFAGQDFDVQVEDSRTKITWKNSLAQGGVESLEQGDIINFSYNYINSASSDSVDFLNSELFIPSEESNVDFFKFVYIEADKKCDVAINGIVQTTINPFLINGVMKNGFFLKTTQINDVIIINKNDDPVNVYFIAGK